MLHPLSPSSSLCPPCVPLPGQLLFVSALCTAGVLPRILLFLPYLQFKACWRNYLRTVRAKGNNCRWTSVSRRETHLQQLIGHWSPQPDPPPPPRTQRGHVHSSGCDSVRARTVTRPPSLRPRSGSWGLTEGEVLRGKVWWAGPQEDLSRLDRKWGVFLIQAHLCPLMETNHSTALTRARQNDWTYFNNNHQQRICWICKCINLNIKSKCLKRVH